ncbi:MAG TPA: hypothetical protein VEC99_13045, partial [Clostridia bacterium]|nr:hypothetical protein [Clostridia bacterium]
MNPGNLSNPSARLRPKLTKAFRIVSLTVVVLLGGLVALFWNDHLAFFRGKAILTSEVMVLEDCDSDFRNPPFEDAVIMIRADRNYVSKLKDLSICETVGGCKSLAVAQDGRFFTVCENVGNKVSAYDLSTGKQLWTVKGESVSAQDFSSTTISPNGTVYALASQNGTIYGDYALVIDEQGRVTKQASVGGFDLTLDPERSVVWLVGKDIKKCDLELKVLLEVNPIKWCGVSVDLDRDGGVWVAERQHPDVAQSTNRIFKLSSNGEILKSVGLTFTPFCVRVDRSNGSIWVTGVAGNKSPTHRLLDSIEKHTGRLPTGKWLRDLLQHPIVRYKTQKYDTNGALHCEIPRGGFSLDIDQADG